MTGLERLTVELNNEVKRVSELKVWLANKEITAYAAWKKQPVLF